MTDTRRIFVHADLKGRDTFTTFGFLNVSVGEYDKSGILWRLCLLCWNLMLTIVSPLVAIAILMTLPKVISTTPWWPVMWLVMGTMIVSMVVIFLVSQASLRWAITRQYDKKGKL